MKRLATCVALTAACCGAAHAGERAADPSTTVVSPAAAPAADSQEELYRAALRALADGHPEQATALLQRVLELEPRHAGAWLDLAISQCEAGNPAQAERLFAGLEQRFTLPPGIVETIARYRATGCANPAAAQSAWLLAATRGHDDNVNQGARDPRFTLGTGSTRTEYELDPAFLPKADDFSQLGISYLRGFGNHGTNAIVQAYSRWHDHERAQDTVSVLGAVEHTWTPGDWRLRATAALGYVTLDRNLYQRQRQLQARLAPPLKLAPGKEVALYANLARVDYPTRPVYDGTTLELGAIAGYRYKRQLTQATLTRLRDDSAAGRPGGDRDGWFGSLQWYGEAAGRLRLEAGVTDQRWRSKSIYSAGLIETRRLQNTTTLRAAGQWQLKPHYNIVLEWRAILNRENIALFQYNSHALQLSLRWDNF